MGLLERLRDRRIAAEARRLVRAGDHDKAIAVVTEADRQTSSVSLERELRDLRYDAFFAHRAEGLDFWPREVTSLLGPEGRIPEIRADELTVETLTNGVIGHGSLVVRDLFSADDVSVLRQCIDGTFDSHDQQLAGHQLADDEPWFVPFRPRSPRGEWSDPDRKWFRETCAELVTDSPRGLARFIETVQRRGVDRLLADYFGERPALSVKKTSFRKVPPDHLVDNGWHQDGAFLGEGIRSMNLWIAVTDCGIDAPSMDMIPRRLNHIVPTGTEGAIFSWSLSKAMVAETAAASPAQRLVFRAGDAVFFDEMNLHSTAADPGMTKTRYAIEAWFFAPSRYPMDQIPLLV